jgi:hypothetical protein
MRAEEARDIAQNTIKQALIAKGVLSQIGESALLGNSSCESKNLSDSEIEYLKELGYCVGYDKYTETYTIQWS